MQTLTVPTTFEHFEISATTCTAKLNTHATNQNQTQVLIKLLPLPHCIQENENQHRESLQIFSSFKDFCQFWIILQELIYLTNTIMKGKTATKVLLLLGKPNQKSLKTNP